MRLPVFAAAAAAGLACTLSCTAQTTKPDAAPAASTQASSPDATRDSKPDSTSPTLSVQARLVVVPAVVREKKGAIVNDLTKDNFALIVDGKPQTVRYFDRDTDLPLTLGLLVDTSGSQRSVLDEERTASSAFLDNLMAPAASTHAGDKAFVVQFAHSVELLGDVTDSRPKLQEALKAIDATERPSFDQSGGGTAPGDTGNGDAHDQGRGSGRDQGRGGTTLYDAVFLASDEIESKQKNRRALVVLTDGEDRGSKESLSRSIEAAQRADTVIYAIYYKGEHGGGFGGGDRPGGYGGGHGGGRGGYGGPGGGGGQGGGGQGGGNRGGYRNDVDGKKILEKMCAETGGRVFEVSKKNTLAVIYGEIGDELRQGYRLGFTPTADEGSDGYHRIELDLAGSAAKRKVDVQTRDGYYTGS